MKKSFTGAILVFECNTYDAEHIRKTQTLATSTGVCVSYEVSIDLWTRGLLGGMLRVHHDFQSIPFDEIEWSHDHLIMCGAQDMAVASVCPINWPGSTFTYPVSLVACSMADCESTMTSKAYLLMRLNGHMTT